MTERDDVEIEIDDGAPANERTESRRDGSSSDVADTATPHRRDSALADELGRVDVMTTPEGHVEATVTDVVDVDGRTVRLAVRLPHGRETTFDLEKPIPWSDEYLLARIVAAAGYDAASIDHVVGESVYLERVSDDDPESISWWSASAAELGRAAAARLAERYDLRVSTTGEWRLVDPRERADATADAPRSGRWRPVAVAAAFLGGLVAVLGAVVAATGSLAVPTTALGAALPGLVLLVIALTVLWRA
ncbi:hypothetical protein [Halovivax limisalsi]|uniref:hypothetical protein n=1 Tax=Halovivax limisalsi TaxID=1453760 RepID=UPI001FFDCD8B|nr:hypothetical protein [Halovivax limisalsi]